MASSGTTTVRSSAEEVECRDELITDILSRVSTRDLFKMSTVLNRWRTLIFDPSFAHTHYKNRQRESMCFFCDRNPVGVDAEESYQFRSSNPQTGNLSLFSVSWEGLDIDLKDELIELVTASNGLLCCVAPDLEEFLVYNPVTKFFKKFPIHFDLFKEGMRWASLIGFCSMQNTRKLVMVGFSVDWKDTYTRVFDSQSNSWYKGSPLFRHIYSLEASQSNSWYKDPPVFHHISANSGRPLFFNGVIYFLVGTRSVDALEGKEPRDVEVLFRDTDGFFYMIIGYDVNQDQWCFSIFIPTSVGYPYCLIEWEGNLLVLASNSTHEEKLFVLAANYPREIRYAKDEGDGHFVFWILDTEHKLWTREWELDLSHEFHSNWTVSASGGVVWFASGRNSVTVYHMKDRHYSTHRLDDALPRWKRKCISCVSFEPTLLSF